MAAKRSLSQSLLEKKLNELIIKNKLDGKNADDDTLMQPTSHRLGINVEYAYDVDEKKIDSIVRSLSATYGILDSDKDKRSYVIGSKPSTKRTLRFIKQKKGSGRVKTEMQEKGTTIVFENVLNGDADFKKETDIMKHPKTARELKATFKGVEHLLDNWTWTFFQQQEQFIKEYKKKSWSEFEYGDKSFVKFFTDEILPKVSRSGGGKADAGKYTGWNPADIWAVRNKSDVQKRLKGAIDDPTPQSLIEINTILVELMEKKPPDLVGISLKMVKYKNNAHIRLFNVDTSPILRKLKSFIPLEQYTMKDIHFEPDNIINLNAVTTYVNYKNKDFSINITRSNNNMSFNTQIKGAAAQGGQTPIDMVMSMLSKGAGQSYFMKNQSQYAQDTVAFRNQEKKYKLMFDLVSKHCSKKSTMKWKEWQNGVCLKFAMDPRDAKVTLMQISFWYDAIMKFSSNTKKSAEFWTDMLYFGMKVTMKGQFAPHAKIS